MLVGLILGGCLHNFRTDVPLPAVGNLATFELLVDAPAAELAESVNQMLEETGLTELMRCSRPEDGVASVVCWSRDWVDHVTLRFEPGTRKLTLYQHPGSTKPGYKPDRRRFMRLKAELRAALELAFGAARVVVYP